MKLSVILITKNEADNLGACLDSVKFANEWIIVDSGSTDGTIELARAAGAQVIVTPDWPGFGPQKNRALDLAQCEWVLSLDADERISEALRDEIMSVIRAPMYDAYAIPRLSSFCGYFIRHSGWYPDRVLRLFRRGCGRFSDDKVHEKVVIQRGATGQLRNHILHYSYRNDSDYLRKLDQYSSLGAQQAYMNGKRATLSNALVHGMSAFIRSYVLKRGFLDGRAGLIVAISSAESAYHKYLKLMLLADSTEDSTQEPKTAKHHRSD